MLDRCRCARDSDIRASHISGAMWAGCGWRGLEQNLLGMASSEQIGEQGWLGCEACCVRAASAVQGKHAEAGLTQLTCQVRKQVCAVCVVAGCCLCLGKSVDAVAGIVCVCVREMR